MLVSSYGAIEQRPLGPGEVLKIDTGHIVAFDEGIGYEVNKVGGWKSTLLSARGSWPRSPALGTCGSRHGAPPTSSGG